MRRLQHHKISLYTDDAGFLLQNPVYSLEELKSLLYWFGSVSGCKVNEMKSVIVGMNRVKEMKDQISSFDSTLWQRTVKYLGATITVALNNETLIGLNLTPLVKDIRGQLERTRSLWLSWFGRLAALKMKVHLRFLFVF